MVKIVNATEAKNHFGHIIQQTYLKGQHLIIKRGNIPVVAIVPMSDYELLIPYKRMPKEISYSMKEEQARRRLIKLLDKVHSITPNVSEKEANQDIEDAIRRVRSDK